MSTVPFHRNRTTPLPADILPRLPSNLDAERSLLGALLINNAAIKEIAGALKVDDFFLPQHKAVFSGILKLTLEVAKKGEEIGGIDLVTLSEHLQGEGKLQEAGGAPYLASLIDGIPRVSNVKHYAGIIIEKAKLRNLIHVTHNIQMRALEAEAGADAIVDNAKNSITAITEGNSSTQNPIVVVPYSELLTLELPKADPMIEPLVTRAGTFMIFSWAGWGKSWIASYMAFCVAHGLDCLFGGHEGPGGHWPVYGPMRTLYLYGEMHGEKIRERLKLIGKHMKVEPNFSDLATVSKDYKRIARAPRCAHAWRPSVKEPKDRKHIEEVIAGEGFQFLVLDNISTLWSAAQEDQSRQVAELKEWFIDLNTRGITVCFLQHAGKGGDFLGDSAQVHILDSYIKLDHPGDYRRSQGLRVVLNVEKIRHELRDPHWGVPFEAQLCTSPENGAEWLTRPAMSAMKKTVFEMFSNGAPPTEVLRAFSILKRPTLYRWHHEWKEKLPSDTSSDDEE